MWFVHEYILAVKSALESRNPLLKSRNPLETQKSTLKSRNPRGLLLEARGVRVVIKRQPPRHNDVLCTKNGLETPYYSK